MKWSLSLLSFYLLKAPFVLAQPTGQLDFTSITKTEIQGSAGQNLANWIQTFYSFSLIGGVFLAVGVIVWAGLKYTLAAGNPSTQSDARDQILQALLGLALLFGAFLILYTINPNLTNLAPPTLNSVTGPAMPAVTAPAGSRNTGPSGACSNCLTELQARQLLLSSVVAINAQPPQTSLDGIKQNTINEVLKIKQDCGCSITVTGGTESGHSAGTESHSNGYKVDLSLGSDINNYIQNNFTYIGVRGSDGAPQWRASNGAIYAKEMNHWDVLVGS